jgi:hypothetical protein
MRLHLIITFISSLIAGNCFSQKNDSYRETIHLHLNSHFYVTGETVLFTVYCQHDAELSQLSSIAYVELVDAELKPVFQTKVKLERGIGSGDFFLAGKFPSGNYTIIAYTRWMRNSSKAIFFRDEITVVNPLSVSMKDSAHETKPASHDIVLSNVDSSPVTIIPEKSNYGFREKVVLTFEQKDTLHVRWFSVSVRPWETPRSSRFQKQQTSVNSVGGERDTKALPDMRGELLSGIVRNRQTGLPQSNVFVSLSSPAKDFMFLISKTNDQGRFYFNANANASDKLFFDLLNSTDDVEFVVDQEFLNSYADFAPSPFVLTKENMLSAQKRLIHSQIENAFYEVKKDSVRSESDGRFFGVPEKIFILRQYTSFPTMEDVFREIIPDIVVKKRGERFSLVLISSLTSYRFENAPFMLIDGVYVKDANIIMAINPNDVAQVALKTRRYYYGGVRFDGIISVETYDGNAKALMNREIVEHTPILKSKVFYFPEYDSAHDLSRIPDYRTQLYWNPLIKLSGESTFVSFYTGDVAGEFSIEVHGITDTGEVFEVRDKISIRNK